MQIGVIGVHYKTTSLVFREALSSSFLSLKKEDFSHVIVATCNRVEMYFSGKDLKRIYYLLLQHVQKSFSCTRLYAYFYQECFVHLAKVAAGLDSALFMESDIQRQIKTAYQAAFLKQQLPKDLHYAFQKALHISKALRSVEPSSQKKTLAHVIWEVASENFSYSLERSVLFIGFSQTNRQILANFRRKGLQRIGISSRQLAAKEFCAKKGIYFEPWGCTKRYGYYDILVIASRQEKPLFTYFSPKSFTLVLDISMPRLIDPVSVGSLVKLYDMDDIDRALARTKKREDVQKMRCRAFVERRAVRLFRLYEDKMESRFFKRQKNSFTQPTKILYQEA